MSLVELEVTALVNFNVYTCSCDEESTRNRYTGGAGLPTTTYIRYVWSKGNYKVVVTVIDAKVEAESDVFSKLKPHQFTPEGKVRVMVVHCMYFNVNITLYNIRSC